MKGSSFNNPTVTFPYLEALFNKLICPLCIISAAIPT